MNSVQLTDRARLAKTTRMAGDERLRRRMRLSSRMGLMAGAVVLSAGLGGCVSVKAPDKPIVIELNINIRQEVVYRLAEDAGKTIEQNKEIF
jgi:hypothetical protein